MPLTDAQKQRIREKERQIHVMKATIARNDTPPEHQEFLRKRIKKAEAYLEARRSEQ